MAMSRRMVFVGIWLLCCSLRVDSGCMYARINKEITEFGTILRYCDWNGLRLLPGSLLYDKERCQKVVCSLDGLRSCGIGIEAGSQIGPAGCRPVPDGCHVRFVETDNPAKVCDFP